MANTFQLRLIKKEPVSRHDAVSFYFDTASMEFFFKPGQYVRMILDKDFEDERGKSRFFSIASSPSQKDHIMITTRIIESGFKKTLSNLEIGEHVNFSGPYGKFVFDEQDKRPRVFIAGGIGMTPFHSMVKYIADKSLFVPITLFASYALFEDILYREELEAISNAHSNIQIVITVTKPAKSKTLWHGEIGRLDADKIKKYVPNFNEHLFLIAGPEGLVDALKTTIAEMGAKDDMIITENFPGY